MKSFDFLFFRIPVFVNRIIDYRSTADYVIITNKCLAFCRIKELFLNRKISFAHTNI